MTADRVLVHVDTGQIRERLVNSRLAYMSISRGRYDVQIYTNDARKLGEETSRNVSKRAALETGHQLPVPDRSQAMLQMEREEQSHSHGQGHNYGVGRLQRPRCKF